MKYRDEHIIDIFGLIREGLTEDYVEPNGHVWKVKAYLNGETKGIEIYTKAGKFLGTAKEEADDHCYGNLFYDVVCRALADYRLVLGTMNSEWNNNPEIHKYIEREMYSTPKAYAFRIWISNLQEIRFFLLYNKQARSNYGNEIDYVMSKIEKTVPPQKCWIYC